MAEDNIKASFQCPVQKVWQTVVSLTNYSWRQEIDQIEIVKSGKKYIEHTKKGKYTTFRITKRETGRRYELSMENTWMKGQWIMLFSEEGKSTALDFTIKAVAKWYMKPFAGFIIKRQQKAYIQNLKKAVEK